MPRGHPGNGMNDYQPQRGDILTKNGEKILIYLVTKTRVIFKLNYLGESKGTHYQDRTEFVHGIQNAQPQPTLARPEEVIA